MDSTTNTEYPSSCAPLHFRPSNAKYFPNLWATERHPAGCIDDEFQIDLSYEPCQVIAFVCVALRQNAVLHFAGACACPLAIEECSVNWKLLHKRADVRKLRAPTCAVDVVVVCVDVVVDVAVAAVGGVHDGY